MNGRATSFAVACLLLVCAALLYLDWWRAGELQVLNERMNELELARQRRTKPKEATSSD